MNSLTNADMVLVTEVFGAREQSSTYSAQNLVEKMGKENVLLKPPCRKLQKS